MLSNMANQKLTAAVLIISDTAYATPSEDKTFPLLRKTFYEEGNGHWGLVNKFIIPDDEARIEEEIKSCCDINSFYNLIVTSGGTGFAVRDRTPEAIGPLIQKHAPGLV